MLPLGHRLAGMVPVLEGFRHVQVSDSLSNLGDFPREFSIVKVIFSDCLKACSEKFCVPLFRQLFGSLSHVKSDLGSFEPLSKRFPLLHKLDI
jgi:hypothetical protein